MRLQLRRHQLGQDMHCPVHDGVPAVLHCERCGTAICRECAREVGAPYCRECGAELLAERSYGERQIRRAHSEVITELDGKAARLSKWLRAVAVLVALATVGTVGFRHLRTARRFAWEWISEPDLNPRAVVATGESTVVVLGDEQLVWVDVKAGRETQRRALPSGAKITGRRARVGPNGFAFSSQQGVFWLNSLGSRWRDIQFQVPAQCVEVNGMVTAAWCVFEPRSRSAGIRSLMRVTLASGKTESTTLPQTGGTVGDIVVTENSVFVVDESFGKRDNHRYLMWFDPRSLQLRGTLGLPPGTGWRPMKNGLFVAACDGEQVTVVQTNGENRWRDRAHAVLVFAPEGAGDVVLTVGPDGTECRDLYTGRLVWRSRICLDGRFAHCRDERIVATAYSEGVPERLLAAPDKPLPVGEERAARVLTCLRLQTGSECWNSGFTVGEKVLLCGDKVVSVQTEEVSKAGGVRSVVRQVEPKTGELEFEWTMAGDVEPVELTADRLVVRLRQGRDISRVLRRGGDALVDPFGLEESVPFELVCIRMDGAPGLLEGL